MEKCPECGCTEFMIVRDMTSRRIGKCGHEWACPPPPTDPYLQAKRDYANQNLPKLAKLLKKNKDPELLEFVQAMTDYYMMNVCELGRRG